MSGFNWISVISLIFYLFIFVTFLVAKKNDKVIYAFMALLMLFILWNGGSFAMRSLFWPSVNFWHYVSVFGILMLLPGYFFFVLNFLGEKHCSGAYFWSAVLLVFSIVNQITGIFIPPPEVIHNGAQIVFIYEYTWHIYVAFAVIIVGILHLYAVIWRYCKGNRIALRQIIPVLIGIGVLVAGHLASTLVVFKGFPLDIISGVINALLIFYALYKKRLFHMTLLLSRGNCYLISLMLGAIIVSNFVQPLQSFLVVVAGMEYVHSVILVALVLILVTALLYLSIKAMFDALFIRNEQQQGAVVAQFSQKTSRLLSMKEVFQNFTQAVMENIAVERLLIFVIDKKGDYRIVHTASELDEKRFTISSDHPIVGYFKTNSGCLLMKDFERKTAYRGVWESEKQLVASLGIECVCPLICENELFGIVMLGNKKDKTAYHAGDLNFLQMLSTICAIAARNASMYEKALEESRRDELTGLLNLKYFYEVLEREFEKGKNSSIALCSISIDDFKLYNQLYGTHEGDVALKSIGAILKASTEGCGFAARISGKEFAVLLPGYDTYSAKVMCENIANQVRDMRHSNGSYTLGSLTLSIGICAAPYMASTPKELLRNADSAMYSVKRSGKNGILMYTEEVYLKEIQDTQYKSGYSEHASTIYALTAAIDTKDHYTFQHSQNVAYYAASLARGMGLEQHMVETVKEAGLLHDIGKIGVREDILNKSGPLTQEEYEIMKGHVDNAANMIRYLPSLEYVIPAVLSHHERYDGGGYPRKLAGEEIPLLGRILCIADAFDAMTSSRSYKQPVSVERALEILKEEANKQFDPTLVSVFIDLVESEKLVVQNTKLAHDLISGLNLDQVVQHSLREEKISDSSELN